MASLSNISRKYFLNSILRGYGRISPKFISTTGKKSDTPDGCGPQQAIYKKDFSKPLQNGNWVSYGGDLEDKGEDRFKVHFFYFTLYTAILCGYGFIYFYGPDKTMSDWARREAFILLNEREQLGLDLVDPNYVDPSKIVLPPDEELTDEDIVI